MPPMMDIFSYILKAHDTFQNSRNVLICLQFRLTDDNYFDISLPLRSYCKTEYRSKQSAHHFHSIFVFWVGVHILEKANNLIRSIA